ncbi:MAG: DUF6901 family protein [Nevskiales bacterium]
MQIVYRFVLKDGTQHRFSVDLDRGPPAAGAAPEWTRLGFHQCANCPLQPEQSPRCPPAVDLAPVIAAFAPIISHDQARVEVETPERTISKDCQVQQALSSLVALIMATSACPILGQLRGLARTHLPLATLEETLYRSVSAYVMGQLLVHQEGGQPDWNLDGLKTLYAELETLNVHFKKRVNAAAKQDAAINAVAALGVLSMGVGFSIDAPWDELAQFVIPTAGSP